MECHFVMTSTRRLLLLTGVLALMMTSGAATRAADLATLPGVHYQYAEVVDGQAGPLQSDPFLRLTDGKKRTRNLATARRPGQAKALRVVFDFGVSVAPERIIITRKFPRDPGQALERIVVHSGDDMEQLRPRGSFAVNPAWSESSDADVTLELENCQGRYLLLDLQQDAHAEHDRVSITEIRVLGSAEARNQISAAGAVTQLQRATAQPRERGSLWAERHVPGNLFTPEENVALRVFCEDDKQAAVTVHGRVTDYWGQVTAALEHTFAGGAEREPWTLDLGQLEPGYYEIKLSRSPDALAAALRPVKPRLFTGTENLENDEGEEADESDGSATPAAEVQSPVLMLSVVVAPQRQLTAAQARAQGLRFGIKMWDRDWYDTHELMGGCARLGLHWTREIFTSPLEALENLGFNLVMKVERFPASCYDDQRYPPIEKWSRAQGVRHKWRKRPTGWGVASVPKKEPYQQWLKEQIAQLPAEQTVFEIWNEPWNKMSAQDFAPLCQWAVEAVRAVRPDAIVGPNLGAKYHWDQPFLELGGLRGSNMVALHPYTQHAPENKFTGGFRQLLRERRRLYEHYAGKPLELYVTEFGWPTPPAGPRAFTTERMQAAFTVRHALVLYAEDVKAFMPHVLGQDESNPEDHEDWYGFFRRDHMPKPVVAAYATCARMIDGSRFIGDLDLGAQVGALLFAREGVLTLALWTGAESKSIHLQPGVESVSMVDLMGRHKQLAVPGGALELTLTGDVIYLVGVGASMRTQLAPFNPLHWPCPTEFIDGKPGRGAMHYPPRESPDDLRWRDGPVVNVPQP